ncbi:MAG: rhomboid family intramembrane serine protease [Bacteroidales bacterium]|nr:rhomboid family intramembrane serine protease [Bacteroidales bacterium]
MEESLQHEERKKFLQSIIYPLIFVITIWMVKIVELEMNWNFARFGLYPLHAKGLWGILFAPLIHSDFQHLINNSIPVLVLSVAIFYFYQEVALKVIFYTWVLTGMAVWFGAREAYHIGASGLIYGFASFLFFSGVIRRNINLLAISLLVVFLYGSMIWGIFPIIPDMSWESHLYGGIVGGILSIIYRRYGPQRKKYDWEDEIDYDDDEEINELIDKELKIKNRGFILKDKEL